MAEVTRVPLQPVSKGALARLWLGILAVVLAGGALAWFTVPKGVSLTTITAGMGQSPERGDVAFVKYVGKLTDGTVFNESSDFPVPVSGLLPEGTPLLLQAGDTIPGFVEGVVRMQKGGKYTLYIPAEKAYGANPPPGSPIPVNADLIFEIELVDFMTREDMDRRVAMIRQMMELQQQAGPGGAEGDPAAAAAPAE
jgi:FKBP-type peptidyl-prolyl cis-trans isomerase FkpA